MAGLDRDLDSVIADITHLPLDRLAELDDSLLCEIIRGIEDEWPRLWSNQEGR